MALLTSCCQICKESSYLVSCAGCKSRYYCSKSCREKDTNHPCKELKEIFAKATDEKKQNATYLMEQFNKNFSKLVNDLRCWKLTSSYKTGILSDYMVIVFEDDGTIITVITLLNIDANIYWPNINPKKAIPVKLRNKIGSAIIKLNF